MTPATNVGHVRLAIVTLVFVCLCLGKCTLLLLHGQRQPAATLWRALLRTVSAARSADVSAIDRIATEYEQQGIREGWL